MRTSVAAIVAVGIACVVAGGLMWSGGLPAQKPDGLAGASGTASHLVPATAAQTGINESVDAELAARLKSICERAGGAVGVAVTQVETGRSASVEGERPLPLYSVFKLPLAIVVLKEVEEGRIRLDQKLRVTPDEVAPGWQGNTDLWRKPVERSVAELLELSLGRSDNTSTDKLLQLVGGATTVTERMRALGFQNIDIRASVREFFSQRGAEHPNTGTASDLVRLLARLHKGELLQPPQLALLRGWLERNTTGARRLRGDLPAHTPVADKTGTGEAGAVTNDVGLITLPDGRGHLAMAVLISRAKLSADAQEKLIAELARVAYDAYLSRPAQANL